MYMGATGVSVFYCERGDTLCMRTCARQHNKHLSQAVTFTRTCRHVFISTHDTALHINDLRDNEFANSNK